MGRRQENKQRVDLHKDFTFKDKNPKKFSLVVATLWMLVGFGISVLGFFLNKRGYLWNLNAGMAVSMVISVIWALVKIGVFESLLFKLQNFRDRNFSQKYDVKIKRETKEEFSDRRRKKSWLGIVCLLSVSILIFVITTIIQFI